MLKLHNCSRSNSVSIIKEHTVASMQKLADIIAREKAQLRINHDKPQGDTMKCPPEFFE